MADVFLVQEFLGVLCVYRHVLLMVGTSTLQMSRIWLCNALRGTHLCVVQVLVVIEETQISLGTGMDFPGAGTGKMMRETILRT